MLAKSLPEGDFAKENDVTTNAMPRGPKVFVGGMVVSVGEYMESGRRMEAVMSHAGGEASIPKSPVTNIEGVATFQSAIPLANGATS